jgi:hypothetical protein
MRSHHKFKKLKFNELSEDLKNNFFIYNTYDDSSTYPIEKIDEYLTKNL